MLSAMLMATTTWADCIEDFGTPEFFGSYEQLQHIQVEIKSNACDFVQIFWNAQTFQGDLVKKMIALDVNAGVIMRSTVAPYSEPTWEMWYGFDKSMILNDDPSDGFDLPNYTTSLDSSKLSEELEKAFREFGL